MKNRLFNHYVTSIIGIIIILGSLYAYFIEKRIEEVALTALVTLGLTLLGSKDPFVLNKRV